MKSEIKSAFQAVIDKRAQADAKREKAAADREAARLAFEGRWRGIRNELVIPALREIAKDLLEPAGWRCQIEDLPVDEIGVEFTVYRGDMRSVGGGYRRPTLTIKAESSGDRVWAHLSTPSMAGSAGNYSLDEVTEELIHKLALKFFERLAG